MRTNRLVTMLLMAAVSLGTARIGVAQASVTPQANPRDVAAVDQAVNGWWTQSMKTRDQRLQWWREARFGCFIHWGVYSGPGGVWEGHFSGTYSEHLMRTQKIPLAEYKGKVVSVFDPEQFNADQWVALIKSAGMKYVIVTAKHHDGFAMWPSEVSKYNIRDATKFKRDPMQELSDACHRNGIRFGFYYSHAMDWEDPNAPGNDWDYQNPGGDLLLLDEKAIPQLKELIGKYHPDIFWFDVSGKLPLSLQLRIVQAVRETDPNVVINGRAARGLGYNFGDYLDTADRPAEIRPTAGDWECIPTCNESYGYHKLDNQYKSPSHFIQLLARAAAKGGNVLLNIGPTGDGVIEEKSADILRGIGKWMNVNGDGVYGTQRTPLDRQAWGDSTLKGGNLYLHVFNWPTDGRLIVGGLMSDPSSACLLCDPQKSPLKIERLTENDVVITVPVQAPDAVDSVVVLKIPGLIKTHPGRLLALNVANCLLAFDGQTQGKLTYGDGKTASYFVAGFAHPSDAITWNIRTNQPATYDVSIKCRSESTDDPGDYQLKFGDQKLDAHLTATTDKKEIQTVKVGQITLPAAEAELRFQATRPGEAIQLFEIILAPT